MNNTENTSTWKTKTAALIIYISITTAFGIGFLVGQVDHTLLKKHLVDKGYAEYNKTNGVWQLK